ncbi:competence type IV pilus minor pilin ComGD [Oceanobacillus massiliensis]|uniref:competence type IV pilus minor pilin ComGD n=1 Tax=Oceanobacillus massiliensis TaxID=1465765 RepID=UPI003018E632
MKKAAQALSPRRQNYNGFTLLEVLFVLAIFSIVLILAPPLNSETLRKQQEKQFLELFKFDVLYIQNLSSMGTGDKVFIRLYSDHYKILRGTRKPIAHRPYPSGLTIDGRGISDISFNEKGTVLHPRKILITTDHTAYDVVFQLGKGRFYIAEK